MGKKIIQALFVGSCLNVVAYQSSDTAGCVIDEILTIAKLADFDTDWQETDDSTNSKKISVDKTHCGRTVQKILSLLLGEKLVVANEYFNGNVNDLKNHKIYDLLFSDPKYSHRGVFAISVCGGHHEFIVERTTSGWRIFQSWLNAFTLKNWVEGDFGSLDPATWEEDFKNYAGAQEINLEKLMAFMQTRISEGCKNSSLNYAFTGFLPVDLEIKHYQWC